MSRSKKEVFVSQYGFKKQNKRNKNKQTTTTNTSKCLKSNMQMRLRYYTVKFNTHLNSLIWTSQSILGLPCKCSGVSSMSSMEIYWDFHGKSVFITSWIIFHWTCTFRVFLLFSFCYPQYELPRLQKEISPRFQTVLGSR